MRDSRDQLIEIWSRTLSLSWPIAVQQTLNTLMRTVDLVVTGLFSPAAIAAIGLADLYSQIPLRMGIGLGTGAIAISSQDTGRNGVTARDQAITQALIIGFVAGIPLIFLGFILAPFLISILGAEAEIVRMGGVYLTIIFVAAPMRIVGLVGSRSLQGTGDTQTPMYVNGSANVLNIFSTVGLGLGIGPLPELAIVGVGLATAVSRTFEAVLMTTAIARRHDLSITGERNLTITRQLVTVSLPNFAEGMSTSIVNFPFNALLLTFGTEVNAAYQIGRRIYQQLTGPLYRSFNVTGSIIVGQALGDGDPGKARISGWAITALGVLTLGIAGIILFVGAQQISQLFTNDPETLEYATTFTRVFGVSMVFLGTFFPLAGSLRGAGDTRTPFIARFTGSFGLMLGFSYFTGVTLGYGLPGVYLGMVLCYAWWALVVAVGFMWGDWADVAAELIDERAGSTH